MKFSIGNVSLRQFVRAVHSLAKIGDEIYFEWIKEGLTVRSVNSSRSAYACFTFYHEFFAKHSDYKNEADEKPIRWKISVKSCLTVFRSQATIDKKVDRCKMTLESDDARLNIQFFCKQGIIKTYRLTIIDCESLQAIFQLKDGMSHLVVSSKLMSDALQHFQPSLEEITICAGEDSVELKNHVQIDAERGKTINTSLILSADEFDVYNIMKCVSLTFCFKELRALLTYGEPGNLPLKIHFEGAGRPIIFIYESDNEVASHFVMATLTDCLGPSETNSTQTSTASQRRPATQQSTHGSQRSAMFDRRETTEYDIRSFLDGDDEEAENAMVDLEMELNGFPKRATSPAFNGVGDISPEPIPKRHCTGLFASILDDGETIPESMSQSYASQPIAGGGNVLVADSDPED